MCVIKLDRTRRQVTDNNKKEKTFFLKCQFSYCTPIYVFSMVYFQKVAEEIEGVPDYLCVLSTLNCCWLHISIHNTLKRAAVKTEEIKGSLSSIQHIQPKEKPFKMVYDWSKLSNYGPQHAASTAFKSSQLVQKFKLLMVEDP